MNGRDVGTFSPISNASNDWSPVTRYGNMNSGDHPYSPTLPYSPAFPPNDRGITPPTSVHSSANTTDGAMLNGMGRPPTNGNPSPPSSVGRSSDGTGLYAASMAEAGLNGRKMPVLEETLGEHYRVLKAYLSPYLTDEKGNPRPSRAKDKLTRLSAVQFQELSTDVYDESIRREQDRKRGGVGAPGNDTPKFLPPKNSFHPKRNQARQKLSTLPLERFRQLATDVYYELERRFPRFGGADIPRMGSPAASIAGSIASQMSRGPPSRVGTPNSINGNMRPRQGPGPAPGYRTGPPPGPPPGVLIPGGGNNEYGRPLPKTFQQNTIVPNKGTMVEDDDEDSGIDDDDAFNLEGAAPRKSSKSLSGVNDKLVADLQTQVSDLQSKLESLEVVLQEKDGEIQRLSETERVRDSNTISERAEWEQLRFSLEEKVDKAETLNSSLRSEIDKLRTENSDMERNLKAQITHLELTPRQQPDANDGQWKQRCDELERELVEQQQIAEEVRRDASMFLQEMRELSARSDNALEKEERLSQQVMSLENELKEWKARYAGAKTQLRSLKASSIGLASLASPDITNYTRDASFATPDGVVKDVHVTKFQLSIDELLQTARRSGPEQVLESMRHVVKCVRAITGDLDGTSISQVQSPNGSVNGDAILSPEKQQAKLKARVSATANNLITASKNHASSSGLSPVSLLDAAASHLSTAVVELVKHVKIRPTPEGELEGEEEDEDKATPLRPSNGYSAYSPFMPSNGNGVNAGLGIGHQRHRSRGGSSGSTGYSTYSSPYSGYDRQSGGFGGMENEKDPGMADFKNYLQEQTDILVQNIGPLVNLIRSSPMSTPQEEQQILEYIQDISRAVKDTGIKTNEVVMTLSNPALKKHAPPVVSVLEECRQNMLSVDVRGGGRDRIPPIAFKTARALKELVLRVDRIESGELTFDQTLQNDF